MSKREKRPSRGSVLLRRLGRERSSVVAACNVSGPAVSQWGSGATKPSPAQRAILHAEFGIPVEAWDEPAVSVLAPSEPQNAPVAPEPGGALDLDTTIAELEKAVRRTMGNLASAGTPGEEAKVMASCATTLAQLAKLRGDDQVTLRKFYRSKDWARIVAAHARALAPFPEAERALANELKPILDDPEGS